MMISESLAARHSRSGRSSQRGSIYSSITGSFFPSAEAGDGEQSAGGGKKAQQPGVQTLIRKRIFDHPFHRRHLEECLRRADLPDRCPDRSGQILRRARDRSPPALTRCSESVRSSGSLWKRRPASRVRSGAPRYPNTRPPRWTRAPSLLPRKACTFRNTASLAGGSSIPTITPRLTSPRSVASCLLPWTAICSASTRTGFLARSPSPGSDRILLVATNHGLFWSNS
jgi:hypothetical protein